MQIAECSVKSQEQEPVVRSRQDRDNRMTNVNDEGFDESESERLNGRRAEGLTSTI